MDVGSVGENSNLGIINMKLITSKIIIFFINKLMSRLKNLK